MQAQVKDAVLELVEGDITRQDTEAIVNAAKSSLLGGLRLSWPNTLVCTGRHQLFAFRAITQ